MKIEDWRNLKDGDVIKNLNGDVEHIIEFDGELYIDGDKSIFPLNEFDWEDWTKIITELS